jgi:hypothetical protein
MQIGGPQRFTPHNFATRRGFLGGGAALLAGGLGSALLTPRTALAEARHDTLGPRQGYSPQVGTFVSMLTWMREENGVLRATEKLSQSDLDVLFDANANTIGALMLHLAATEVYYGMNTFDGMKWDKWLMAEYKDPQWGLVNNLCKWFHVCEHEAHHTGQIALLKKRLPGAKPDAG